MPASRYDPGTVPRRGLSLQPRDLEMLRAVLKYRVVTSGQLHALLFAGRSLRVVQARLRLLFEHRLLNRLFVPVVLSASPLRRRSNHQPLYTLSGKGLQLLRDVSTPEDSGNLRRTAPEYSASTVLHHLAVSDCLVSLVVALRVHADLELVSAVTESELWLPMLRHRGRGERQPLIVPDGAFTIRHRLTGETMTFYLEVVRAGVSGGNRRLQAKFARYAEWSHVGRFATVYGHERVRAVLIATTSAERAEHFRQLAAALVHGRGLFWFGVYGEPDAEGIWRSTFTPERILTLPWTTVLPGPRTLLDALPKSPT